MSHTNAYPGHSSQTSRKRVEILRTAGGRRRHHESQPVRHGFARIAAATIAATIAMVSWGLVVGFSIHSTAGGIAVLTMLLFDAMESRP